MSSQDHTQAVVPEFNSLIGQKGLHIQDHIEDVQAIFYTDQKVEPKRASIDGFVYPVDSAAEISVTRLKTSTRLNIYIRDSTGNLISEFIPTEGPMKVQAGDHLLEFTALGMKIYAKVADTGFRIIPSDDDIEIVFDPDTVVRLGARSFHSQPARTLTTTSDPQDLMRAISLFGNEMKTWSPERTWPSLRGHPPLLEIGDSCQISEHLTPPANDIRLTVPAKYDWVYPSVPLAYWLGATVEPGPPVLHVGSESYPLGTDGGYQANSDREAFEEHVRNILQFTFFLDSAVRTEGFYDVDLDSRRKIEASGLELDYESLYESSLASRIQTYLDLDVSFDSFEERIGRPDWRLTADVQPTPEQASIMPFLARDLAVVRCPSESKLARSAGAAAGGMENVFSRTSSPSPSTTSPSNSDVLTRSSSSSTNTTRTDSGAEDVVQLPEADSMSQAWVGDGFAVGAAKASTGSYLQRLEKYAEGSSQITIDVIVNDDKMADEANVSEIYGSRDQLDFDINVQKNLSSSELAAAFERETDFIHYIGHVDPEGFDCPDGYLDANQLGNVGADMFVLNACSSYEQGQTLVDKGAIAGVVTLEDVINSMATKIGRSVARLLNFGFPIGSATNIIQETMFSGSHYIVLGDSNAALAQPNVGVPNVTRVSLRDDGLFDVTLETFASWYFDIGSMYRPYIECCEYHYLVPGEMETWAIDDSQLNEFLTTSTFPIVGENNLYWSNEMSAASLRERLERYE